MIKNLRSTYLIFLTLFVMFFCLANCLGATFFSFYSYQMTVGTLLYPLTFIISTTATELWGVKKARQLIMSGFFINLLLLFTLCLYYKTFYINAITFISSLTAFLIGQVTDIYFYQYLRHRFSQRSILACSFLCLIGAQFLDTCIVNISVLFIGLKMEFKKGVLVIFCNLFYKIVFSSFLLPLIYFFIKITQKPQGARS